jgi:hypothetical protein
MSDDLDKADEPINLSRFYELLQDHAQGSVQCKGAEGVMFFGSTGVGKSTMLYLLAGAEFSYESVELESELGGVVTYQHLRTQMEIPGCAIGKRFVLQISVVCRHFCQRMGISILITHACNFCRTLSDLDDAAAEQPLRLLD